jgi:kumamolisin
MVEKYYIIPIDNIKLLSNNKKNVSLLLIDRKTMAKKMKRTTIHGSERTLMAGSKVEGSVEPDERFEVTLRLRPITPLDQLSAGGVDSDVLPQDRHYLSREEFAAIHGADPNDIAKVEAFAKEQNLVVVEASVDRRSVVLSGTASAFAAAFGTKLQHYEYPDGTFRGRTGSLTIPEELDGVIEGVFGLDDRPQATSKIQQANPTGSIQAFAASISYTPVQLAKLYNFPSGLDGTGQCIAIIELGGGYRTADLKTYFTAQGLPVPKVKTVRVDGAKNSPSTANSADGEVMLDIEVAAAIAPKAQIVVYFAPNTSKGFLDAITKAIHDTVNKPSVISISWGGPESTWTSQSMQQYSQAFQAAATLGISVYCAAGDNGSGDGVSDGKPHVDFPASSSYVMGCGGTNLQVNSSTIVTETVWNEGPNSATGGGVSGFFPRPAYQVSAQVPPNAANRGVPDVAADADPATGYAVRVDGQNLVFGGTSAVAPLWAGLTALMNQKLGKPVGFLNPLIYGSLAGKGLFNDITHGNNGAFSAMPGWDACTGWGSPNGAKLLAALSR